MHFEAFCKMSVCVCVCIFEHALAHQPCILFFL